MASKVKSCYKKKHESHVKTDYAYHHTKHVVKQHTERYEVETHLLLHKAQLLLLCQVEQNAHTELFDEEQICQLVLMFLLSMCPLPSYLSICPLTSD